VARRQNAGRRFDVSGDWPSATPDAPCAATDVTSEARHPNQMGEAYDELYWMLMIRSPGCAVTTST
jgi:hypothetical protein